MTPAYPERESERTAWIRGLRPPRRPRDLASAYGSFVEEEPDGRGATVRVGTLLLTDRECPFTCLMCDLWRDTVTGPVPEGALPAQVRAALATLPAPPVPRVKLYNAGSFFDAAAVPPGDHPALAALLAPFEVTTVECHPSLVGPAALAFARRLPGRLELALGLETVHPHVLPRLNKRMTVESFLAAAALARGGGLLLRVFVLVGLPFVSRDESLDAARRTVDVALGAGAGVVSLIPLRSGNGALDALEARGELQRPTLEMLERTHAHALAAAAACGAVALADTWDLHGLGACPVCRTERIERLRRSSLAQRRLPDVTCGACGGTA